MTSVAALHRGIRLSVAALTAMAALGAPGASAQDTHALVVVGLGGTDAFRQRFGTWAKDLHAALTGPRGLAEANVVVLAERPDVAPGIVKDRSTKENVLSELTAMAARAGPDDRILLVLMGHGTATGDEGRINLPGPDLSGADLEVPLSGFGARTVALVHTGSAGGDFVAALSGPGRIVLSATRSARERNATEFAGFFIEALAGDGADLDKDGSVSLLEAFTYTRAEVARYYDEENEILTEHAVLDDNGDGEGSPDPGAEAADGRLADLFRFRGSAVSATVNVDDPVLAGLYAERQAIQGRLDELRTRRDTMSEEEYDAALEALLVELALKTREIRAKEGGG